jgi:hypothetical protein
MSSTIKKIKDQPQMVGLLKLPLLDSNQRMSVPKTDALPLGEGAIVNLFSR